MNPDQFRDERRQQMFDLVRAFGFEPDEVIEESLRFDGANVQFQTMPGRIPHFYGARGMNETQRGALNALIYPRVVQEDPAATQPTPEPCCEHGAQLETLAAEIKRANQLLADLVEVRRGQARGGIVKNPSRASILENSGCVAQAAPTDQCDHGPGYCAEHDVYRVTIPPASRAQMYWERKQAEAQAEDYRDLELGTVPDRLAEAAERITLEDPRAAVHDVIESRKHP